MIGVSYRTPRISVLVSTLLTSTSRRGLSWNFRKPSRLARNVTSSSIPDAMYPKWAGGTFLRMTGSKSNTLIASPGLVMRSCRSAGAQVIGSGRVCGAAGDECAARPASPGKASSGLPANHFSRCRRLASLSLEFMARPSWFFLGEDALGKAQNPRRGFLRRSVQHHRPHTHMRAAPYPVYRDVPVTGRTECRGHVGILLLSPLFVTVGVDQQHRRQIGAEVA